ncbi:RHS repeat-associated core domain-containing protein [Kitasatospora sp. NPDC057512]|uniref:RHS repeat-associated core domain-containing protein n=1 Tax=Kitasatospora sp. NPDC057512 TaxID=3346154 RepID=UPI003684C104
MGAAPLVWQYTYDGDRLTKACDPDNRCTTYHHTTGSHYRSVVLDSRPDAYWRLADAPGSPTAGSEVKVNLGKDDGGYRNVTLGVPGGPAAGSGATAATFSGNSSVVLADGQAVRSRNLAVELWFRTTASGPLFGHQSSPMGQDSTSSVPVLYVGTDGVLRGEFWYGKAAPLIGGPVADGRWHHVVLSGAVGSQTLYLDGRRTASVDGTIESEGVTRTQIGAASSGTPAGAWPGWPSDRRNQWYFTGDIAEVAYYTHPLGDVAVAGHHAAGQPADLLDRITLPSGRTASAMTYDTVNDRIRTRTDHNGGLWRLDAPTVSGSADNPVRTVLVTDPGNRWHQYDYDAFRGRILRYIAPSATDPAADPQHPTAPPTSAPPCPPPPGSDPGYCGGPVGGGSTWSGGPIKGQGVRSYDYDADGFQSAVTDEVGHRITFGHDARGNVTSRTTCRTGPADCQTAYTSYYVNPDNPFDPRNDKPTDTRDARSANPGDNTYRTHTDYTADGRVAATTTPDGAVVRQTYTDGSEAAYPPGGGNTPAGLVKATTDARGKTTAYQYYASGDLAQVTGPTGDTTRYGYDPLGRRTGETRLSDGLPGGSATTSYAYDSASRLVSTTEPGAANVVTGAVHTARTSTEYDADGNPTRVRVDDLTGGDRSREYRYDYDDRGRLVKATDPEQKATGYGYDGFGNRTSVTDPTGTVTVYAYTARNKLYQVRLHGWSGDAPGGDTATPRPDLVLESFSYDQAGRVTRHSDAMGRTLVYGYHQDDLLHTVTATGVDNSLDVTLEENGYDAAGHLTRKVEPGKRATAYEIDAAGRTSARTEDPGGLDRRTAYTYDPAGNVLKTTRTGKPSNFTGYSTATPETVSYSYDDAGRELTATVANAPAPSVTSRAYYPNGLLKSITDPRGNAPGADAAAYTTTFGYDQLGRPTTVTAPPVSAESGGSRPGPVRPVTATGYDTFGAIAQLRDPLGAVTTTDHDGNGRPVRTTSPSYTPPGATQALTPTRTTGYDDAGRVSSTTDPRGNTTRYGYDQLGRVVSVQDPSPDGTRPGGVWSHTYTRTGEPLSTTDPLGATVRYTYDDLGRPATRSLIERKPQTVTLTTGYGYDAAGRLTTVTSPTGARTSYTHDALDQVLTTTSPANVVTTYGYDPAGRPAQTTDAAGRVRTSWYDPAGRLVATTDAAPNGAELRSVSTSYDLAGNPVARTDALGRTTTWTVDALNRATGQSEPVADGQTITTSTGYDAAGRPTRYTDGRGNSTTTGYNSLGLPESVVEPATKAHPGAADRTWTTGYDAAGNPVALTEPGGVTRHRGYDNLGRLTGETGTGAESPTADRVREYDPLGRLTAADAPGGRDTFEYNDRGLLVATDGPSGKSAFGYDEDGLLLTRSDAAGTATYTYLNGRLSGIRDGLTGTTTGVGYTTDGQVARLTYGSGHVRTFGYDDLGRVSSDTVKNAAGTTVTSAVYGYDLNGRLTARNTTGGAGAGGNAYGYDQAGRLTSWTDPGGRATAYAWDAAGNRVGNGGRTAVFDERNRLLADGDSTYTYTPRGTLAARTPNGGSAVPASFDAFGRLVSQGTAAYSYDGLDRVATRNGTAFAYSGAAGLLASDGDTRYARGPGGEPVALQQGSVKRLTLTDQHGDLVGGLDPADGGAGPADSVAFDPFGNPTATTGAKRSLGFQGAWTDPSTGQVDMAARWYDPSRGAFTSRDDVALSATPSGNANRYLYAGGSPLDGTDPTGHETCRARSWLGALGCLLTRGLGAAGEENRGTGTGLGTGSFMDLDMVANPIPPDFDRQLAKVMAEAWAEAMRKCGVLCDPQWGNRTDPYADDKLLACGGNGLHSRYGQACVPRPRRDDPSETETEPEPTRPPAWRPAEPRAGRPMPPPDPAIRARADNQVRARTVPVDVPARLGIPAFADPGEQISCGPSCPAARAGAQSQVVTDAEQVWKQFRDVLVDPSHSIVAVLSDLTDTAPAGGPAPAQALSGVECSTDGRRRSDGSGAADVRSCEGTAVVHHHGGQGANLHFSVEVMHPNGDVWHTELKPTADEKATIIRNYGGPNGHTTYGFRLPNGPAAWEYLEKNVNTMGKEPYNFLTNSCLTYVCAVLQAGGVTDIPGTRANWAKEGFRSVFRNDG